MSRLLVLVLACAMPCSAAAEAKPPATLIVGGDHGVSEVRLDGSVVRVLSKTAAQHPRYSVDHRLVYFLTAKGGELRVVSLFDADPKERVVAQLPRQYTACADAAEHKAGDRFRLDELSVQADQDFVVDAGGKAACINLKDRNINMMDFSVDLYVALSTGTVTQAIAYPECPQGQHVPRCAGRPAELSATEDRAPRIGYGIDEAGRLVRRSADGATAVVSTLGAGDFHAELASPSGRWLAITGNVEEGDYIYRDLFLLDRNAGQIWPARANKPRPLTAQQLKTLGKVQLETVRLIGESALRWLPGLDVLLADSELVTPGVGIAKLPGQLAR